MKPLIRFSIFISIMITIVATDMGYSFEPIGSGKPAPGFSAKDTNGTAHDLSEMKKEPMIILYFFDVESKSSQEGLLSLDKLSREYKDAGMNIWGITLSSGEKVKKFIDRVQPGFPVIIDNTDISDLYHATLILPTICIVGPGNKVLDYFQGGGKSSEIMLVRLAERQLQRKQTMLANAISDQVREKNPENMEARAVKGYAALNQGNLHEAEETFKALSKTKGQGEILGKEGLAAVYAKNGQTEKALEMASVVERKAPERSYVHVIKGDLLYNQNKKEEAAVQYRKAIQKKEAAPYQKAIAYNQSGRIQAELGDYEKARGLYDMAIEIDPYYIEATSNKGVAFEKEGRWDKALEAYRNAMTLDKNDTFAAVLAQKAEEMLALQKDSAQKKRIDKLVKDLADKYRTMKKRGSKSEDVWTSRPMVMTFVDFTEKGGLAERDGISLVMTTQLGDQLNDSGRVRVVERVVMERLLEELNIGSSELADPETALRLGRVMAAKVICTGTLYHMPNGTMFNLRLIDTETSAIPKVITRKMSLNGSFAKELHRLNQNILETIIEKYPLQGYVVTASKEKVMINIGVNQGVVLGTKFDVIEEKNPVMFNGKMLRSFPESIAQLEIIQVEPDLSYARIIKQEKSLKMEDKVREQVENTTAGI